MVANVVVLADVAIAVALGPGALLYLFASLYFSIGGLHVRGYSETRSGTSAAP